MYFRYIFIDLPSHTRCQMSAENFQSEGQEKSMKLL